MCLGYFDPVDILFEKTMYDFRSELTDAVAYTKTLVNNTVITYCRDLGPVNAL